MKRILRHCLQREQVGKTIRIRTIPCRLSFTRVAVVVLLEQITFLEVKVHCQVLDPKPNYMFNTVLQLINEDAELGKLVLMEDSDSDSYVAIGEVMALDYSPERTGNGRGAAGEQIRVILKLVTKPDTILPFKVRSSDGKVICRTLGEAFSKKKGVMWLLSDTVLTQPDGCTVVKWV